MDRECTRRIYSEEYQDYLVEYYERAEFLKEQYEADCFQLLSNRFAVAYTKGNEIASNVNSGAYVIPQYYGLMSSDAVLEVTGVSKTQRQPALNLFGQGVLVGFIDTGAGVRQ